ncbi:MAG: hypothetical protein IPM15_22965 [Betaproteobacteria bacterium]|jgi:hypothetical protein|nr:hypothetical protein [Betaproteobacteria bacterium]
MPPSTSLPADRRPRRLLDRRTFGDVRVTPTMFVIDRRGGIAAHHEGAPDFTGLHTLLDGLLAQPA